MGFLRRLFGGKKHRNPPPEPASKPGKDKRSWSFAKSSTRDKSNSLSTLHNNNPSDNSTSSATFTDNLDPSKHAIAVAAATAAVAEAALAAAHAAAEVVRLTSGNGAGNSAGRLADAAKVRRRLSEETAAAVKIQSTFRGYLARRALRALKALVKLQALVRGHIVRKQTADMLRRMQTLVRLQSRARASRVHMPGTKHSYKSSLSHYPVPDDYDHPLRVYSTKFDGSSIVKVPDDYDHPLRVYSTKFDGSSILKRCSSNANFRDINSERARFGSNWLDSWMEENARSQTGDASLKNGHPDDEKSDKILEVDTWKPHLNYHHSTNSSFQTPHRCLPSDYNNGNFMAYESPSKRSSKAHNPSLSSREAFSVGSPRFQKGREEVALRTSENSPQALSASSRLGSGARGGPFTPTKSECSWGFFNGYTGYPSYMANTESSRAKVRSHSVPRQRMEFERYGSTRRSIQSLWEAGPNSDRDSDSDFRSKAYSTTSSLNRIGSTNLR